MRSEESGANPESGLVWVNGDLVPRAEATVSVFDASFQSGDSVWEGIRYYQGVAFRLEAHLRRLREAAIALEIELPSARELAEGVYAVLDASGWVDDVHARLIVSRGRRRMSGMDPRNVESGPNVVIIPELKPVAQDPSPLRLTTSTVRRSGPDSLDSAIHHSNQVVSILARLGAYRAGADAALMLDPWGFVAEADTATFFCVLDGRIVTPALGVFVRGITRGIVLDLCRIMGLEVDERRVTLAEVYASSEAFICGTVAELVPISEVDGRRIEGGEMGPCTRSLLHSYREVVGREVARGRRLSDFA